MKQAWAEIRSRGRDWRRSVQGRSTFKRAPAPRTAGARLNVLLQYSRSIAGAGLNLLLPPHSCPEDICRSTINRAPATHSAPALLIMLLWLVCVLSTPLPSFAQTDPVPPEARTVIGLYDPKEDQFLHFSMLHRLAEMPLNHLGLAIEYHDINDGVPDIKDRKDVRGVITWFKPGHRMADPAAYLDWATKVVESGKKYVMMDDPGFFEDKRKKPTPLPIVNRFLRRLGMVTNQGWFNITYDVRFIYKDPLMIEFERNYEGYKEPFAHLRVINDSALPHLKVRKGYSSDNDSDLVVTGKKGSYVATGYANYYKEAEGVRQWYINPFTFFRKAFDTDALPKPDTTTIAGRRIYYSHIDGDGWNNLTQLEKYRKRPPISAQVILEDAIKQYPDFPVSVAPIAADLDKEWMAEKDSQRVAYDLFLLPQVEMASHTYSHPFYWQFFEDGNSDKEWPLLGRYSSRTWSDGSLRKWVDLLSGKSFITDMDDIPGMTKDYETPRAYAVEPFSIKKEIFGSLGTINTLAPQGKKVKVIMWSGDTHPFEEAVRLSRQAGIRNINGGDSRFDREYPSFSWVAPVGMQVGRQQQIFASNSNENTYTDLWRGRYYGFKYLVGTVQNTETPIRLKPFNVYYHMYSGEKQASLNALLDNLRYARTQSLAPVTASNYCAIADGFYSTRLVPLGKHMWRVENRDGLQTIRFDQATYLTVDFEKSQGIVGARFYQGSLYVYLDEEVPAPVIAVKEKKRISGHGEAPYPYLIEGRWKVWGIKREPAQVTFMAQGFGKGEMVWHVPEDTTYTVLVRNREIEATAKGNRLYVVIEDTAVTPLKIRIRKKERDTGLGARE